MQKASVRGLAFGSWERAPAPPPVPTPAPASPPAVATTAEPAPASPEPAAALALAASAFHQGSASHAQLRLLCKSVGLRTSFDGASSATLASLLAEVLRYNGAETALAAGGEPLLPHSLLPLATGRARAAMREFAYRSTIDACSLEHLAGCLPDAAWEQYERDGFAKLSLELRRSERGLLALSYDAALAELGVDAADATTYANARHCAGYDLAWGWLRNPTSTPSAHYLATHPRVYAWHVGFYARLVLSHDLRDDATGRLLAEPGAAPAADAPLATEAVLHLRLQAYDTKLKLPSTKATSFEHIDADWARAAATPFCAPALQCVVCTSPSAGTFSAKFCAVGERLAAAAGADAARPYTFPRAADDPASFARALPDSLVDGAAWIDAGPLDAGDVLLFTTFTAHRFSQTGGGGAGLRTAEYPSLSCVAMHGAPHQSEAEVLRAVLAGVPPERWAHAYTGNVNHKAAADVRPLLPPPPPPLTPLARALVGVDAWRASADAFAWVVADATAPDAADRDAHTRRELAAHRRDVLPELRAALRRRLRRLAAPAAVTRADAAAGLGRRRAALSAIAKPAADVVPRAAAAAQARDDARRRGRRVRSPEVL